MAEYLEVPGPEGEFCVCDECRKNLRVKEGYLAIPPEWIELPQNKRRREAAIALAQSQGRSIYDMTGPGIVCQECAKKYEPKLNLQLAKQDLGYWIRTGKVPLRTNAASYEEHRVGSSSRGAAGRGVLPAESRRKVQGKKVCALCGKGVPEGVIECPQCGNSRFAYETGATESVLTETMQNVSPPLERRTRWWQFWK